MIICDFKKYSFAFTLAEVLITLGIIGIVAALTIPTLMQNFQENAWKQAWKKQYSIINQAYNQMKDDNGGTLMDWLGRPQGNYTPDDPFLVEFSKYFSVIKNNLGASRYENLSYKTLAGNPINTNNLAYGNFILKDGTRLLFRTSNTPYIQIWIDVNGYFKGPNTLGKDLFVITLGDKKLIPLGAAGSNVENTCTDTANSVTPSSGYHAPDDFSGAGCSAEYLYK